MKRAASGSPFRFQRADYWALAKCGVTDFGLKYTHVRHTYTNKPIQTIWHTSTSTMQLHGYVTFVSRKPTGCFLLSLLCFQAVTVVNKGFSWSKYVVMEWPIETQCNPVYVYFKTPVSIAVSCFIWRAHNKRKAASYRRIEVCGQLFLGQFPQKTCWQQGKHRCKL